MTNSANRVVDFYAKHKKHKTAVYHLKADESPENVRGLINYYFYDRGFITEFEGVEKAAETGSFKVFIREGY